MTNEQDHGHVEIIAKKTAGLLHTKPYQVKINGDYVHYFSMEIINKPGEVPHVVLSLPIKSIKEVEE